MVRPENVSLTANGDNENRASGTLKETIMIGQITKYFLELPDGTEMVATMLTDRGAPIAEKGAAVTFHWAVQDTRVFADSTDTDSV